MTHSAFVLGERLVGDVTHEVLEESVLTVLGRARIGLDSEHLLAQERVEQRLELTLGKRSERRERARGERLAENCSVLEQPPLLGRKTVEAGGDERVQRLRDRERGGRAD